jgi:hypothetical protein
MFNLQNLLNRLADAIDDGISLVLTTLNFFRDLQLLKKFAKYFIPISGSFLLFLAATSLLIFGIVGPKSSGKQLSFLSNEELKSISLVLSIILLLISIFVMIFFSFDLIYLVIFQTLGISVDKKISSIKDKAILYLKAAFSSILSLFGSLFCVFDLKYFLAGVIGFGLLIAAIYLPIISLPININIIISILLGILALIFLSYWSIGYYIHYYSRLIFTHYYVLLGNGVIESLKLSWNNTPNFKRIFVVRLIGDFAIIALWYIISIMAELSAASLILFLLGLILFVLGIFIIYSFQALFLVILFKKYVLKQELFPKPTKASAKREKQK